MVQIITIKTCHAKIAIYQIHLGHNFIVQFRVIIRIAHIHAVLNAHAILAVSTIFQFFYIKRFMGIFAAINIVAA